MPRRNAMLTGSPVGHGAGVGSGGQRTAVRLGTLTLVAVAVLSLATPGRAQTVRDSATAPTLDSVTEAERRRLTGDTANLRLIIATPDRRLFLLQGADTVFAAPIGVGTGLSLSFGASTWRFSTPLGEWRVRRKILDPVWVPPDWHYAETAWNHRLLLVRLPRSGFTLRSGRRLEIRNNAVGIVFPDGEFAELPLDEHIVFEGTLFIPPLGTRNRRVEGNLGRYALDLGGGYLIHGTTDASSIGAASTHGCIRVSDDDLRWLFEHVPVGMRVLVR